MGIQKNKIGKRLGVSNKGLIEILTLSKRQQIFLWVNNRIGYLNKRIDELESDLRRRKVELSIVKNVRLFINNKEKRNYF